MGRPRVLIIDDEVAHLKLYSWILEREGFLTATALVERDGIDLPAKEEQFDLTLLDYRLQVGIKAVDVVKKLRDRWPGMRVVILSDMMWLPDDMTAHADGFIRKGEPQLLIERVSELTRYPEHPATGSI
jgi:DNA-binding NtrC family response regulator